MSKIAKIAISLPEDILESVEAERKLKGESRSELFRRAVNVLLKQRRERMAVNEYVCGYQEIPESVERIASGLLQELVRKHAIIVGGRRFPPKQLLEAVLEAKGKNMDRRVWRISPRMPTIFSPVWDLTM